MQTLLVLIFLVFRVVGQLPQPPYEVSTHDFRYDPNWEETPNFFEAWIHRGDELYESSCATDPRDSLLRHKDCAFLEVRNDPAPPSASCRIVINEVNTDNPGDSNEKIFIELKETCFKTPRNRMKKLTGFKLIIIGGHSESVEFVADLRELTLPDGMTEDKFIVVGTDRVPNVNMDLKNTWVQSVYNNPGHTYGLPVGDNSPFAVILLYSTRLMDLRDIQLLSIPSTGFYESLPITDAVAAKIKKFSQDQVVYGRKCATNRCDIFERTWFNPTILNPNKRYLLRDWDYPNANKQDYSLNRCTYDSRPFQPEVFKLGIPSPGVENNCDNAIRFLLEENFDQVSVLLPTTVEPTSSVPQWCASGILNIPNQRYDLVSENLYLKKRDEVMQTEERVCIKDSGPTTSYADTEMEVDVNNEILKEGGEQEVIPPYDTKNFDLSWIPRAKPFLPAGSTILEEPQYQSWLRIKFTDASPVRFSCGICSTMVDKYFKIERNHNKDIMTERGYFSPQRSKNQNEIIAHAKDHVHQEAEAVLREVYAEKTRTLVMKMIENRDSTSSKLLLPTIKMIRTVYMEASSAIPFSKHEGIVKLQKINDVNLGIHHYSKKGATEITKVISDTFHEALLDYLVKNDKDFSIIVDATTDTLNNPFLTVHFQTIEENRPVIFFYRVLYLAKGESSAEMKKILWDAFVSDSTPERDFQGYVKRRLICFVSDGGANMVASKNSLYVHLKREIGREFPNIICMAHKLENSIKRGIEKSTDPDMVFFSTFNKSVNKLYVFYSSRGSKKWAHFVETAEKLGIKPQRIKYYFDIRWASSHFICLENIYKDYAALIVDTEDISADASFTKAGRTEANNLYNMLINKSWVLVLHEFLDILSVYKQVSLDLQQQAGTLPGKAGIIERAIEKLNQLKSSPGAYMTKFLALTACKTSPCSSGHCSMEEYEQCETVLYSNEYELTDNDPDYLLVLSAKREVLYDSIIAGLNHYFNIEDLRHFELFNQKRYQKPECSSARDSQPSQARQSTASSDLEYLGKFYGMAQESIEDMKLNWDSFLQELLKTDHYVKNLDQPFEIFWPFVLKDEYKILHHLTEPLKNLLRKMLVTPFSSAEAERAFSFLTREKSGSRATLSPETLDHIMRIGINGDREISRFDALKPTLKWLKEHCRVDDPGFQFAREEPKPWNKLLPASAIFHQ